MSLASLSHLVSTGTYYKPNYKASIFLLYYRFKEFDGIQFEDIDRVWSILARVEIKFDVQDNGE